MADDDARAGYGSKPARTPRPDVSAMISLKVDNIPPHMS